MSQLYVKVIGGQKKQQLYGPGNKTSTFVPSSAYSNNSTPLASDDKALRREIDQEVEQRVEARIAGLIETVEANVEAMMQRIMERLLRQGYHPLAIVPSREFPTTARPADATDEDTSMDMGDH